MTDDAHKELNLGEAVAEGGVIYAGETYSVESISDTKPVYTMPEDLKDADGNKIKLTLEQAGEQADKFNEIAFLGREDWHVPTDGELDALRRARNHGLLSNSFNEAVYLSSSPDPAYRDCTGGLSFGSDWRQERMRETDKALVRLVCGPPLNT